LLAQITVPKQTQQHWPKFTRLRARLHQHTSDWPGELQAVRQWYEPHLRDQFDDADARAADLAQLQEIAGEYASRQRFLTELTLDPPDSRARIDKPMSDDDDCLVLSTIHSAKGLEWPIVRILNVVDGCIPSSKATRPEEIEEELRLLHVGMTRAKRELDLIVPVKYFSYRQRSQGDDHFYSQRSRLIPESIEHFFDRRRWKPKSDGPSAAASDKGPIIDVSANVGRLWT